MESIKFYAYYWEVIGMGLSTSFTKVQAYI